MDESEFKARRRQMMINDWLDRAKILAAFVLFIAVLFFALALGFTIWKIVFSGGVVVDARRFASDCAAVVMDSDKCTMLWQALQSEARH
jgi:hypothetical protein